MKTGTINATGRVHFRPGDAKFLKLETANVDVEALVCMDCGHLALTADTAKLKSLIEES
jgi:hypothetical protein